MSGRFIVIEGPDGSGTTTHTDALAERLKNEGVDVFLTREPSSGPIGKDIRRYLDGSNITPDALQLLFTADRAWHVQSEILPALEQGKTVVCEQYDLSTLVFGTAAGLDPAWLQEINKTFVRPDELLILLPPFEECVRRLGERETRDILEGESFQQKVYGGYVRYAKENGIEVIDTSGDIQSASDEIYSRIK